MKIEDMDATAILALSMVALALSAPIGIALHKPTKYESYNEALRHCSNLHGIESQNNCRVTVTKLYVGDHNDTNGQ